MSPSALRPSLEQLADDCGVLIEYHDIWGRAHRASDETLRAILAALGVLEGEPTAETLRSALHARALARWSRWLPPVVVVAVGETAFTVRLHVPAIDDHAPLRWQIDTEEGAVLTGEFTPAHAPEMERGQLDLLGDRPVIARALRIESVPPAGYHRLSVLDEKGALRGAALLLVAPTRCYWPPALGDGPATGRRVWGPTVQLYSVRSERNWGVGDFTDLLHLVELWGSDGADVIGLNPLHALFPHNPLHASPYSPSSRLFINVLYIDVEAVPEFASCAAARARVQAPEFQQRIARLRAAPLVDYAGVRAAKFEILELLFADLMSSEWSAERGDQLAERRGAFADFVQAGGELLKQQAEYEALQEHLAERDASIWGWPVWPEEFRDPRGLAVQAFTQQHAHRVAFYQYLQWLCEQQLEAAAQRAQALGLAIGLYADLAVSVDSAGVETWANRAVYAPALRIGAPPDDFNQKGQDWGLPPWNPAALGDAGLAPFIALMRANMRHAGALRIDHVMALLRLYVVPASLDATQGAYLHYPLNELLAVVALESHRNRCLVIGEDLGTVPDSIRTALANAGVLSYKLLYFEREHDGAFRAPANFPAQAIVAASTHDLPTLAGWWEEQDLALRESLHLFPQPDAAAAQRAARRRDREQLVRALAREQLLPEAEALQPDGGAGEPMSASLACAIHAYVGRAASVIAVVQPEDIFGVREQVNLPGTTHQHPNWLRRLPVPLEAWAGDARVRAVVAALRAARPRSAPAPAPQMRRKTSTILPRATYRLQLNRHFTFEQATALIPYLAELGISHVYCAPYLRARAGSLHGYDIIDHNTLNPEIGTPADFERFVATLRAHGMGQIVDVVPNHMGVMGSDNAWWLDVLENGPASEYADHFDIDWHPLDPTLEGKVLVPVLGDHYGRVLERAELRVAFDAATGGFAVRYFEHAFPLDPRTYPVLLESALRGAGDASPGACSELASLIEALRELPPRSAQSAQRRIEKEQLKRGLAALVEAHPAIASAIDSALARHNGTVANGAAANGTAANSTGARSARFDRLHALLEAQAYRLSYWRVAADEINYRRFFDINELAALRMEERAVFDATHRQILQWAARGALDGLRIDHADGLLDPAQYCEWLQQGYRDALAAAGAPPANANDDAAPALYVVLEKIVASHEQMPDWPVHGTTGYRFATLLNGLLIDSANKSRVDRAWRAFVRDEADDYAEVAYQSRREILLGPLASELTVLAARLLKIARSDRRTRDFTLSSLRQALATVVACFPVYRTYIVERPSAQDRRYIEWAVGRARRRLRTADPSIFDFVRNVLLAQSATGSTRLQGGKAGGLEAGDGSTGKSEAMREVASEVISEIRAFARRFQQFTAPVAAKGIEDTAFYRYNRLLSLNEVGGDPDEFGMSVAAWHAASRDRSTHWPHTMLGTTTHDSKRSEDVRCRLNVLSEMPAAWRLAVRRWSRINRRHKRTVEGETAPSRNDEYALYQLLAGTCPTGALDDAALAAWRTRVEQAWIKGAREAKQRTSWANVHPAYEATLSAFIGGALDRADGNLFLEDLRAQAAPIAWFGLLNSITLALLKFTSPGVPDLYQGNELLTLRLVDPDNRAPVDYARCQAALSELRALSAEPRAALFRPGKEDLAKLWVTWRTLTARRAQRALFERGEYIPLEVSGARAAHVIAFARRDTEQPGEIAVVIAGRLCATMGVAQGQLPCGVEVWGDTALDLSPLATAPGAVLFDALDDADHGARPIVLDGPRLLVAAALRGFPGALLLARSLR